jgi:hypothetical protein
MRGEPAAVAVLLSVLALGACASARQSRPEEFSPPLTAGMAREYTNDFKTVLNAARVAAAWGPQDLFSEETVDSSTVVFWTRYTSTGLAPYVSPRKSSATLLDDVRIVVQSLAPGRTVVRMHSPVPEMSVITSDRLNLLFANIEFRLE